MPNPIDEFEKYFAPNYQVTRKSIQDGERLTLSHLDQRVHIDYFPSSGKLWVSGSKGSLKDKVNDIVNSFRSDPQFFQKQTIGSGQANPISLEQEILEVISSELYNFLPEHDRKAMLAAYQVLRECPSLPDFSPVTMPVARVYEGFLAKVLVHVGICTQTTVEDANFNFHNAFGSKDAKKFCDKLTTHQTKLEAMKQRLKEYRHTHLHSQSSKFDQCNSAQKAKRFAKRVLDDMQAYYDYWKNHFVL
ncbi:MAG TPA: hypothetical protein VKW70_03670 [Terriglobia bacterium]|nr:hypothetical protein [Terriglobia bacterium]